MLRLHLSADVAATAASSISVTAYGSEQYLAHNRQFILRPDSAIISVIHIYLEGLDETGSFNTVYTDVCSYDRSA